MSLIDDIKRDPIEVHLSDARQIAAALIAADELADAVQDLPDGPYHALYAALAAYRKATEAQT
jgi:hypothetical protein